MRRFRADGCDTTWRRRAMTTLWWPLSAGCGRETYPDMRAHTHTHAQTPSLPLLLKPKQMFSKPIEDQPSLSLSLPHSSPPTRRSRAGGCDTTWRRRAMTTPWPPLSVGSARPTQTRGHIHTHDTNTTPPPPNTHTHTHTRTHTRTYVHTHAILSFSFESTQMFCMTY